MSYEDKVWAKRAAALRLNEVERIQGTAQKWRDGLIALTALLTAVTIVKGPEKITELTPTGRVVVTILLSVALAALLLGSGAAMRAAFGYPPEDQLTSSGALKKWSSDEAHKASRYLYLATVCFFIAVPLVFAATLLMWFDDDWFAKAEQPRVVVVVERNDAVPPARTCGELAKLDNNKVEIKRPKDDPLEGNTVIPLTAVRSMAAVDSCPKG